MTSFLPAGIINDGIAAIYEKAMKLRDEDDVQKLKDGLVEIEEIALDLTVFLRKLSCQPLIYTGHGNTEEVINRLEWALTFSEGINPVDYINYQRLGKKKHTR